MNICFYSAVKTSAQCTCSPNLTLKEHFERSDVVFIGKVVETKKIRQHNNENYDVVIKFEVQKVWKKDLEKLVLVKENFGDISGFEPNTEWLLYVFKGTDGTLQIVRNCCSRTKLLSVATKQGDLKAFKKIGEKLKKIL